jgi:hypothetical protein
MKKEEEILIDLLEKFGQRINVDVDGNLSHEPEWNATVITDEDLDKFLDENS